MWKSSRIVELSVEFSCEHRGVPSRWALSSAFLSTKVHKMVMLADLAKYFAQPEAALLIR